MTILEVVLLILVVALSIVAGVGWTAWWGLRHLWIIERCHAASRNYFADLEHESEPGADYTARDRRD